MGETAYQTAMSEYASFLQNLALTLSRNTCRALLGVATWALTSSMVLAADLGPDAAPDRAPAELNQWQLSFAPYAWFPWLTGDLTIKGQTADVDTNIFELLGESDSVIPWETDTIIPWMGYMEARKGKMSAYLDSIYAKVALSGDAARQANPLPDLSLGARGQTGVMFKYAVIEAGAAYEIGRWGTGGGHTTVDLFAGARYWHQELSMSLAIEGQVTLPNGFQQSGAIARSGTASVDWVDPLVGLRVRYGIAPGQGLMLRGDIGGFGVASDFTWQVVTTYNFELGETHGIMWSGVVGYRALYADYSEGTGSSRYAYDLLQHGPLLGLKMRF
jgi:hypothetical protein